MSSLIEQRNLGEIGIKVCLLHDAAVFGRVGQRREQLRLIECEEAITLGIRERDPQISTSSSGIGTSTSVGAVTPSAPITPVVPTP